MAPGVMRQVLYSSSASTFCRNEIKERNYLWFSRNPSKLNYHASEK